MKSKQLIRFYFSAEFLNEALDNLILADAVKSANYQKSGEYYFERISKVIEAKSRLSELWKYLDGIISRFNGHDKAVLKYYALLRTGVSRLNTESVKEIKRVTVRFTRRARYIERFGEGVELVKKYYCLMGK